MTHNQMTQLVFDLGHREALDRDNFLIAPSNEDAVGWIDKWPDWPAPVLILSGPLAAGKSHLAAVWGQQSKALSLSHDHLVEESASSLATQSNHFILEEADLWIGDKDIETTLFHLYNILKEEKRSCLMTMRIPPAHLSFTVKDLASRLRSAPIAQINPPDDILLSAILVKLFSDRQIQISQDVLSYALPRMERSFISARTLVEKADTLALTEKKPITVPLIRRILLDMQSA